MSNFRDHRLFDTKEDTCKLLDSRVQNHVYVMIAL